MAVLETLRFRLWDGELVDQFLRSNAQVEREYLSTRPGFDRGWRTTSLADDGTWTITTRWASGVDAEGAMAGLAKAPGAAAFLACIGDPITVHREVEVPSPTSRKVDHAHRLYLEGIRDGDARRAVHAYTGDRYTQHSTGVRDGAEGFLAFFEPFLERNPKREITIHRTIADGRYVFVHVAQNLNDGESRWVTADLFDTDGNDRIVEHWDVIAPLQGPNPSGHSQVDGVTAITDLHLTEANKEVVRRLLTEGLAERPTADLSEFISADTYIQHNPDAPDGLEGLRALMVAGRESGETLYYQRVHRLIGQGNFVVALSHQVWAGIDYAAFDIFRLEGGLAVEHWDAVEPLPVGDALVNRGKF